MLEEKKDLLAGSEYMDSFVFNPHKWMLTNFDCSAYFVKDPEALIKTMTINPEYLKTAQDDEVNNYRNWGIQLGRRFRALKLWFVLRDYGIEGIQEMVSNHIEWAQDFESWVEASEDFELLAPVNVSLVCFRWNGEEYGFSLGERGWIRGNGQIRRQGHAGQAMGVFAPVRHVRGLVGIPRPERHWTM